MLMLITNNNNNKLNNTNITFWLLLCCDVLFVSGLLINTTLACTTISSSCGSFVGGNGTTSNSTSVQAHWEVLDRDILELTCQQQRLTNVLSLLKINSTLNNEIISIRSKHLEKITKAITLLNQESTYLKLAWKAARNISLVLRNGQTYEYEDGTRAKSCREYKNPIHPYKYNNQGSGLYNIESSNGGDIITVYCDMISNGGGWTLTMMTSDSSQYIYEHTVWTDTTIKNTQENIFTTLNDNRDYVSKSFYTLKGSESRISFKTLSSYNSWYHTLDTTRNLANGVAMTSTQGGVSTCASQTNCGTQPINKTPLGMLSSIGYTYPTNTWNRFGYINYKSGWGEIRVGFSSDNDSTDDQDAIFGIGLKCVGGCVSYTTIPGSPHSKGSGYYAISHWSPSIPVHDLPLRAWLWIR